MIKHPPNPRLDEIIANEALAKAEAEYIASLLKLNPEIGIVRQKGKVRYYAFVGGYDVSPAYADHPLDLIVRIARKRACASG